MIFSYTFSNQGTQSPGSGRMLVPVKSPVTARCHHANTAIGQAITHPTFRDDLLLCVFQSCPISGSWDAVTWERGNVGPTLSLSTLPSPTCVPLVPLWTLVSNSSFVSSSLYYRDFVCVYIVYSLCFCITAHCALVDRSML